MSLFCQGLAGWGLGFAFRFVRLCAQFSIRSPLSASCIDGSDVVSILRSLVLVITLRHLSLSDTSIAPSLLPPYGSRSHMVTVRSVAPIV